MPKRFESLPGRLASLGWTAGQIENAAREVAEHWEDLEGEGRERGLDAEAAAGFADERLGSPETLARQFAEAMRRATWWGRHPVLGFVLLPPVALVAWFAAWMVSAVALDGLARLMFPALPKVTDHYLVLLCGVYGMHYLGATLVPAFFWWRARRGFCAMKWGWGACVVCAVHGYFNHLTLRLDSLSWGYGAAMPADWLPVLAPLVVAGLAHWGERRRQAQFLGPPAGPAPATAGLALLLAAAVLGGGCAASKPQRQRGWIGGEFKVAKAGSPFAGSAVVPAFPRKLKGVQSSGILVTTLGTNAPAYLGGVREGDLVLKVGSQPVGNVRAFRRLIDTTPPGAMVALTVYRGDAMVERRVVVGLERFERWHTLSVGLLLGREWDLWPNPDFSLIALGYKGDARRVELSSPEEQFIQRVRTAEEGPGASERGVTSREGWEMWLALFSVGGRNRILAQEVIHRWLKRGKQPVERVLTHF